MSDNILSQAEIDKLLNADGHESEVSEEKSDPHSDSDVKPYDPTTQRRVVRERLQALEIINERFARAFRVGLFNLLRRSPDITVGPIQIQPYHEFARNMPIPTHLNLVHMNPLRGTVLFVFSPNLVFIAIDNLFGGDGRFPTRVEGREFTHTEQRIINRMLQMALDFYQEAWRGIYPVTLEYVRSEMQIKFTNITTSPNDIIINTTFSIEIGGLTGEFNICIPFAMIEPLRELLTNPPIENSKEDDAAWRNLLASEITQSTVEVVANFAEISSNFGEILKLEKGDVLTIDKPGKIEALVGGIPVVRGRYGKINKQYALRVDEVINSALGQFHEELKK